jgi:hypothetical protein
MKDNSYKQYLPEYKFIPEVPENRIIQIGDKVDIGNLHNIEVISVSSDYKTILVEHDNFERDRTSDRKQTTFYWFEVFKLEKNLEHSNLSTKNKFDLSNAYYSRQLDSIIRMLFRIGVDFEASYQRDYVWDESDKIKLLDSVFGHKPIGSAVCLKYNYPNSRYEVVDGKQRLSTLIDFYCSKFMYKGYYFHELSDADKRTFEETKLPFAELNGEMYTEREKLELFLSINDSGVPQLESHLTAIKEKLNKKIKQGIQ